jgi:hypothetical protein
MTSFPAAPGSSCGNGKWCSAGKCVKHQKAPNGNCNSEDNFELCESFTRRFNLRNTCLNFANTQCCMMCGGKKIEPREDHSLTRWVSKASLNSVTWIDEKITPKCADKYNWCGLLVERLLPKFPDVCNKSFLVNNEIILFVCRKSCLSCK